HGHPPHRRGRQQGPVLRHATRRAGAAVPLEDSPPLEKQGQSLFFSSKRCLRNLVVRIVLAEGSELLVRLLVPACAAQLDDAREPALGRLFLELRSARGATWHHP